MNNYPNRSPRDEQKSSGMKNKPDGFNCRLETAVEKISELENVE